MSKIEEVNKVKSLMLEVCEKITVLDKDGVRIEFSINNGQLITFLAYEKMKLSS